MAEAVLAPAQHAPSKEGASPQTQPIGKVPFDRATSTYLFAAVRSDLPPAVQGVQLCHAVARAVQAGGLTDDTRFVLVQVPDQTALLALADRLETDGHVPHVFVEPDHAQGETALALSPGAAVQGKRFSRWPLWSPTAPSA